MMQLDRTPNKNAGDKVEGEVLFPDACGVYDVRDNNTGECGVLLRFECGKQNIQIILDEENLSMMLLALTDLHAVIASQNKPTDPKGMN